MTDHTWLSTVTLLDPAVFQFVHVMGKDDVNKVGIMGHFNVIAN